MKQIKLRKIVALIMLVSIGTGNIASPSFASENKGNPITQKNEMRTEKAYHTSLDVKPVSDQITNFAQTMNMYVQMFLNRSDINFELKGQEDFVKKMKNDQSAARKNAADWENDLKRMLMDTNHTIISYDPAFQNMCNNIIEAVQNKDKRMVRAVRANLQTLQTSIADKQQKMQHVTTELKQFRERVGVDVRELTNNTNDFSRLFQKEGLTDESIENALMEMWDKLGSLSSFGIPWYSPEKIKREQDNIHQLFTYKKDMPKMLESITDVIDVIVGLSVHGDSIDAICKGLLERVNDASTVSFTFVLPEIAAAKDQWEVLKTSADALETEIQKLK